MKTIKKDLKNIEISTTEKGFTIWITERKKVNGRIKTMKHWIVDASLLKKDGKIRLGASDIWKLNAEYSGKDNTIYVTRK